MRNAIGSKNVRQYSLYSLRNSLYSSASSALALEMGTSQPGVRKWAWPWCEQMPTVPSADNWYLPPSGQQRAPSLNGPGVQFAWTSAANDSGDLPVSVR